MAEKYDLLPFELKVLAVRRTLCEKIMSLVRFSHTEDPITDLRNKIRHTYDLHLMLKDKEVQAFFESDDFDRLLKTVARDDVASYRSDVEWLAIHPVEAIIFRDLDQVWAQLKNTYEQDFQYLVFGELPKQADIHASLTKIKTRLHEIDWDIEANEEA
jgi:hypothetical protein